MVLSHSGLGISEIESYSDLPGLRRRIRDIYKELKQQCLKCEEEEETRETKKNNLKNMLTNLAEEDRNEQAI